MEFRYRYVPFGTHFTGAPGVRTARPSPGLDESKLYENELAVDVGGGFAWAATAPSLPVIDHHFFRDGQFPSAAAAVLHKAGEIYDRFLQVDDPIWLVTHRQPDFDAFCAMYLAQASCKVAIPMASGRSRTMAGPTLG